MGKLKGNSIHEQAIRLIEGGVVNVDGHFVRAVKVNWESDTCDLCEMDCLCHFGTEMLAVCIACDSIDTNNYYLKLVNKKRR